MTVSNRLRQHPLPGNHITAFCGDVQTFSLSLDVPLKGKAWIRTNIGHLGVLRKETIDRIERGIPSLGQDWFDIPMRRIHDRLFQVTLALTETGHAQAKCFFLEDGKTDPEWPEGPNTVLNIGSAHTCCANIIYNAFVRQFGPNKAGHAAPHADEQHWIRELDSTGYTVIPKSGTFRDLIGELDFIFGTLGCRFLHLLPIHPTPTTYARMGRFGSPYAALSFTAVDPAQAQFDPTATPLEQFIELVDAVHAHQAHILIDIAPNHTGWAAGLHETHPEWLVRGQDGRIEVPGAWGVQWEDLTRLDYSKTELWKYMAEVFLTWCRRGVDGFRCDAGYMIPVPAWQYIVSVVREQYPDTIFFLEGLGGKISVARDILSTAGFDWAYSELFQNYDRGQIESYLPDALDISREDGLLVHFAETHDNNRLAARSFIYARMRTALCALLSHLGGFGFTNGVEWLATEKIIVHESPSLNWGAAINQIDPIRRLSLILRTHPTFQDHTRIQFVEIGPGNYLSLFRCHEPSQQTLLIVVNLDDQQSTTACWFPQHSVRVLWDLLSGKAVSLLESDGHHRCHLDPGQVLCLTDDENVFQRFHLQLDQPLEFPDYLKRQCLRAKVLDIHEAIHGLQDIDDLDVNQTASLLAADPVACCRKMNPFTHEPRIVFWNWPQDGRRLVMLPPDHFLLIRAPKAFRAKIMDSDRTLVQEQSLTDDNGNPFVLIPPLPVPSRSCVYGLKLSIYFPERCTHLEASLLALTRPDDPIFPCLYSHADIAGSDAMFLAANERGAMLRAPIAWGDLTSRYDALLAANLNPDIPENRWIMMTRFRAWGLYQGYSTELCMDCFDAFTQDTSGWGLWRFRVPSGQGEHILLTVGMRLDPHENRLRMLWYRYPTDGNRSSLPDTRPVQIILRPDIENRNFHETTKAYLGSETLFPTCVTAVPDGFIFHPDPLHRLEVRVPGGNYHSEPHWQYMVHRRLEAERGLDPDSDLFSPGYFSISLTGGQKAELTACITAAEAAPPAQAQTRFRKRLDSAFDDPVPPTFSDGLKTALRQYIVNRGKLKSVIAGFPWFLDWGRDALIAVRGMIAAGFLDEARNVLIQFGQFEHRGTLPNMICGDDAANRDTSDAPLWFFTACNDLIRAEGKDRFLSHACGSRTLREVLVSIAESYLSGTPNGICIDPDSGLVFSPAHYTWMDTNHPAGTPREGYAIEIQALWYAALAFLSRHDQPEKTGKWQTLALHVRNSVMELFVLPEEGYLSDCLHAAPGTPARMAKRDDASRPNQLLAITLGLIDDADICDTMLAACQSLLVPGAIRSLADRPVKHPLEIRHNGQLINDPHTPYQGRYTGDEDTRRKPAYHNGTAWTWQFPSYCEAWFMRYGDEGKNTARAILYSSLDLIRSGCIGHIPEILDGNFPHTSRGCDAQAWGVSELLRVWLLTS
jgi:starch synthase (maltosyl-transferring)